MKFFPDEHGYIKDWLICGPQQTDVEWKEDNSAYAELPLVNNLIYWRKDEADNAQAMYVPAMQQYDGVGVELGAKGPGGHNWRYHRCGENNLITDKTYYFQIKRVELHAFTQLVSPEETMAELVFYTHAATDAWLNGEFLPVSDIIDYRPLKKVKHTIRLKKGVNTLYLRHQNAGIRDTRVIFGARIYGAKGISVSLPADDAVLERINALFTFAESVCLKNGELCANTEPPTAFRVQCTEVEKIQKSGMPEPERGTDDASCKVWKKGTVYKVGSNAAKVILHAETDGYCCDRNLYNFTLTAPKFEKSHSYGQSRQQKIMRHFIQPRQRTGGHSGIYNAIAAFALGENGPDEEAAIEDAIAYINKRNDCSEFSLSGLLRIYLSYPLRDELKEKIKKTALEFRYWADEAGTDAMCMNSENHRALFNGCQIIAGRLFPDEIFTASGRTGREQRQIGLKRCYKLIEHFEKNGFVEFTSGAYVPVTLGALLNLHDFCGEPELTRRVACLIDGIVREAAMHTLHGICAPPMGRIYKEVTAPYESGTQALLYWITDQAAVAYNHWLCAFASSSYKMPEDVLLLMETPLNTAYSNGGANLVLYKTPHAMLSSVQIGMEENERGFVAGEFGYQEHLFYASLEGECLFFATHPGEPYFESTHRPGYWYGNGLYPAIQQQGSMAGVVFATQGRYPVQFVHVYYPSWLFDEEHCCENWRFVRKGNAYFAMWCSTQLEEYDGVVCNAELRTRRENAAFVFCVSDITESGSFDDFMKKMQGLNPMFDETTYELNCGSLKVKYHCFENC